MERMGERIGWERKGKEMKEGRDEKSKRRHEKNKV